jgi:hypothetical protein
MMHFLLCIFSPAYRKAYRLAALVRRVEQRILQGGTP